MVDLVDEARRMPDASLNIASHVAWISTPNHLASLREHVRTQRRAELNVLFTTLNERFGASERFIGVFYAAGELAMMEAVARTQLAAGDRVSLRAPWERLLRAS
jgi:hypothetical protein